MNKQSLLKWTNSRFWAQSPLSWDMGAHWKRIHSVKVNDFSLWVPVHFKLYCPQASRCKEEEEEAEEEEEEEEKEEETMIWTKRLRNKKTEVSSSRKSDNSSFH